MKKIKLFILSLVCLASVQAQKDELQYIKEILKKEKKELVREYMAFNDAEAAKFWPLYETYQAEKAAISKDRIGVIRDYANQFKTLDDAQANNLANRLLDNNLKGAKLDKKWYKRFSKAVSPLKAAQYMQMEQYFQTLIRSEVQEAIPFIGEIERRKG